MNELTINLKNIKRNIEQKKATLKNGCRFCAVIKANAYGLGAERVAHAIENNVDYFAVARTSELAKLRSSGITKPIIVLGRLFESEISEALANNGEIQASSFEELVQISKIATALGKIAFVHLAFNTGMNRFGFSPSAAQDVAAFAKQLQNICIKGVFSHFHSPTNAVETLKQKKQFDKIIGNFNGAIFHISASCASANQALQYNMVRVGIDIFVGKHPALSLSGKVVQTFNLKKGDSCGYNKTYTANASERVATISLGYADALPRVAAGRANVVIHDQKCPIVAVCMDTAIVKIPSNTPVFPGDEAFVFGKCKKTFANIFDFAKDCDTITYEILTGISQRVKRKYIYR